MKAKMNKVLAFIMSVVICMGLFVCVAEAESEVLAVIGKLESIDTLQQMQDKRSSYTASSHYDITTTSTKIINNHNTARNNYDAYLEDMFAKREAAKTAYEALTDAQKAQIDEALVAKLSEELPTSYLIKEYPIVPRSDEYTYEAINAEFGYAYEVSNYMISGKYTADGVAKRSNQIPQTFILVDTSDGKTSWTPSGEYAYGESNYLLTYCCDMKTGIEHGTDYKRTNLEESGYFNEEEARHIRAVMQNSYPYVTMDEMKAWLIENGLDADFVSTLNRADMIAAVQMSIWAYANKNDITAEGVEYFASIDVPKNIGKYFTPLHEYTNEIWDWLPGAKTRSFDTKAQYRVNKLGNFLIELDAVPAEREQIVISEIEVVRTELVAEYNGVYGITVYVTLNGGGDERDDLRITAVSYTENEDGSINATDAATTKAIPEENFYSIDLSAKGGDLIRVEIEGEQYLAKGAYFYAPEGERGTSQSLVGVAEGYTHVKAEKETIFTKPEYTIIAPDAVDVSMGEKTVLKTEVIPEVGAPAVLYSSSDEDVVKVDEEGNIETVGIGTATITAYLEDDETKVVTITITVKPPEYKIETPERMELPEGATELLYVKITPDDGRLSPTFSSADESIARVDEFGNVTGVKAGITTIYIDFGNGEIRAVPVTVIAEADPVLPSVPKTHYVCFGKTDGIGWYEVSVNGGDFFPQGPNSTLEVQEGSVLVVRVQDMWIDDEFDFYVNGSKVPMDTANTITVVVDGYMLIGALSMDVEVPDVDESLNLFQRIIRAIKNFFGNIGEWFESLFSW